MPLEDAEYLGDLDPESPKSGEPKSAGDNHLRLLKRVLKATFPNIRGAMTVAHDQIASKDDIEAAQFASALPAQSLGFLRSNGSAAGFTTTHTGYAQNEVKGADVTSAATVDLTQPGGNLVHITGTTAITGITVPVGADRALIFDGVLTLTHGAALLLPTGANIVTQAGDRAIVRGDSAGAIVTHYQRADGTALAQPVIPPPNYALLGQATISTAVANVDFLSLFSGTYDRYVIELEGIGASAADLLTIRLAKTGAADAGALYTTASDQSSGAQAATQTQAALTTTFVSNGAFTIDIRNANSATRAKGIGVRGTAYAATPTPGYAAILREAVYVGANAVTGFRLFFASGANFTEGTVRVYGVRNT